MSASLDDIQKDMRSLLEEMSQLRNAANNSTRETTAALKKLETRVQALESKIKGGQ